MQQVADEPLRAIRTPDRRLRVFISSTLGELAEERAAARAAISGLGLAPVFFEAGARPHPPRELYRAYLAQSDVFVGIYWEQYGWVAPGEERSGLEDEWLLAGARPRLLYVKTPGPRRDPRLAELLSRIERDGVASYRLFRSAGELADLLQDDLAVLLTEQFEAALARNPRRGRPVEDTARRRRSPPLPVAATPLVGRAHEADDVRALLARPDVRLVTLSGPGGIGKSRIALEVAHRLAGSDRDVAWVGSVGALRNADLVPSALAEALHVDERPGQDTLDVLTDELRGVALLLVVDGFEPVLGAADQLAELLARCPRLQLLVTSRAVLRLRAEHDYPVPPLSLPVDDCRCQDSDAVRLFVETATAASPSFRLTADNTPVVAAICRRLDGIPLALELAAPRVRLLTPEALLARLSSRLDLLTGGATDLPERHQTLRAALAWDYDLLDGDERALFRRLAVCEGGFAIDLADAVAAISGGLRIDLLDALESLVGKSLLRHRRMRGAPDRFAMLDTVREYALERLAEAGEDRPARTAHAAHLLRRLEALDLRGARQLRSLEEIHREHDNYRAALRWTIEAEDTATELRLVARLSWFWKERGHLAEGSRWVRQALDRTADAEDVARVELLAGAAQFARADGDFAAAASLLEQAQRLAEHVGDRRWLAQTHHDLAAVLGENGRWEAAQNESVLAHAIYEEIGDDVGRGHALNALGVGAEMRGDLASALDFYRSGLELLLGRERAGVALVLMNIGCVLTAVGSAADGERLLLRSLGLWEQLDNAWYATDCLEFLGYAVAAAGAPRDAVRLLATATALRTRIGAARAPAQTEEYDAHVAKLGSILGPAVFEAAWERGLRERFEDVVAEVATAAGAQSQLDPSPDDLDTDLLAVIRAARAGPGTPASS